MSQNDLESQANSVDPDPKLYYGTNSRLEKVGCPLPMNSAQDVLIFSMFCMK